MSVTPYDYQTEGAHFLASRPRAYLADEAGLGKTIQALLAIEQVCTPTVWVVCCPASVVLNWMDEARRVLNQAVWSLLQVREPEHVSHLHSSSRCVLFVTYGLVSTRKDLMDALACLAKERASVGLILDEAHFLKNAEAKRTEALLGGGGLQACCSSVWCLSATPAPNNIVELYPALRTIHPAALLKPSGGMLTQHEFMDVYTHWSMGDYGPRIHANRKDRMPVLRKLLAPVVLRRKKADVLSHLPPVQWAHLTVESSAASARAAMSVLGDHVNAHTLDDQETVRRVLENPSISRALHALGLLKVQGVVEYVADRLSDNADKVILFAHHQDVIAALSDRLSGLRPVVIDGSRSPEQRHLSVHQFQTDPTCRVFIGQNTAAGTGITLTAASEVLLVEPSWVPADNYQIASRAHRIGQTRGVVARFVSLSVDGMGSSLDRTLQGALVRKTEMIANLFD